MRLAPVTYAALIAAVGLAGAVAVLVTLPARAQTCPDPTPTAVTVSAVPIVVASTTDDYFVLYASFDVDGTEVELPVAVVRGEAGTTTIEENVEALPADRYRVEKYAVSDPADVDGDCIDDITELDDLGSMNPLNPAMTIEIEHGALAIPDLETFETLSIESPNSETQEYLKFVIFDFGTAQQRVYFMNTNRYQHHGSFEEYLVEEYSVEGRQPELNGTLAYEPKLAERDHAEGVNFFYRVRCCAPNHFVNGARIHALIAASMPMLELPLGLQLQSFLLPDLQQELPLYWESRIPLVFDEELFPEAASVSLNAAVGYGLLRVLEPDERPHPRDVVVYEALPNTLPRVAGIITTAVQTPLSHVNLRAIQDGIPNAYIRDGIEDRRISNLLNRYVRYEVTETSWRIRPATRDEVEAHYESSRPAEAQTPERDLSVTEITPLSDIGFDDWDAFGVKAANVAELAKLGFPDGTVPEGFAIPFHFYDEFMKQAVLGEETVLGKGSAPDEEKITLPAGTTLSAAVTAMLAHAHFQSDLDIQEEMLDDLRDAIEDAETPQWIIDAIVDMNTAFDAAFGSGLNRRYRSSTNNEDLPGFNGAGLYDSKSQKPSEDEDDLAKSLKEVYASLWNFRAFTEREFYRIDHESTAMGILVHPSYQDELVNGVAVSFDPVGGQDRYYVNSQVGEDLVTNPEAFSIPEELLLHLSGTYYEILAFSNLAEPGELLMSGAQLRQLRDSLTVIHDHFEGLYDPAPGESFAMEIEFKITSEDILAIKQARPWVFSKAVSPPPPPPVPPPPEPPTPPQQQSTSPPQSNTGGGGGGGFGPAPVAPKFVDGFRTTRDLPENSKAGDPIGDPVDATHPDDLDITYSLSGADAASFTVDEETGQLRMKEGMSPVMGNSYSVNLTATDSAGVGAIIIVVVNVTEATHHAYDLNRNGAIDRDEVVAAVKDYFDGLITKDDVIEMVKLYFAGAG